MRTSTELVNGAGFLVVGVQLSTEQRLGEEDELPILKLRVVHPAEDVSER